MSSNDVNSTEIALQCVGCQYDLTGLAPDGACPECGMSIANSRLVSYRAGAPARSVRAIRTLLTMTLTSTCVGVPVMIMFAAYTHLHGMLGLGGSLLLTFLFMTCALVGMILPLVTIFLVPAETRTERMLVPSIISLLIGLVGIALIGTFYRPELDPTAMLGMGLATIACILNLTRANRAVGNVIPDWTRLGPARQKKEPLLVAVALIMGGRFLVMRGLLSLDTNGSIFEFWGYLALTGLEVLLVIGGCYVLGNRLWMGRKLFESIQQGPSLSR